MPPLPNLWWRPDPWRTFSHVFWYAGYVLSLEWAGNRGAPI